MTQTTIQTTTTQTTTPTQPAAGGFPRQRQAGADPATLPEQRTVARVGPGSVVPVTPAAAEPTTQPQVRGRGGLQALVTRVLRRTPATADQVEQAAARAAWARQHPSAGHGDMLLVNQPFLRSLK